MKTVELRLEIWERARDVHGAYGFDELILGEGTLDGQEDEREG